jgi:carbonic anhydrase
VIDARNPEERPDDALDRLIEANVLLQLNHLRTHPSVAGGLARGTLEVYGWVYDIAHGAVRSYEESTREWTTAE